MSLLAALCAPPTHQPQGIGVGLDQHDRRSGSTEAILNGDPVLQSPGLDQGGTVLHSCALARAQGQAAGVGGPYSQAACSLLGSGSLICHTWYPRPDAGSFSVRESLRDGQNPGEGPTSQCSLSEA